MRIVSSLTCNFFPQTFVLHSPKHKCLPGEELPSHQEMNLSREEWDRISLKTDDWWGTDTSTCKFRGFTKEQLEEIKTIVQKNPSSDARLKGVYNVQVVFSHFPFHLVDSRPKRWSLHAVSGNTFTSLFNFTF